MRAFVGCLGVALWAGCRSTADGPVADTDGVAEADSASTPSDSDAAETGDTSDEPVADDTGAGVDSEVAPDTDAPADTDAPVLDTGWVDTGDVVLSPPRCVAAPAFTVDEVWLVTNEVWFASVTGGTSEFSMRLASVEESGLPGEFDRDIGVYLAPPDPVHARLIRTEEGCVDASGAFPETFVDVFVVAPMEVPARLDLTMGDDIDLASLVAGGSAAVGCSVLHDGTASTLETCVFSSALDEGADSGVATIQIEDLLTGQATTLSVVVTRATAFQPKFSFVGVPLGSSWTPQWTASVGAVSYALPAGWSRIGDALVPSTPGTFRIRATDPRTGHSAEVVVSVYSSMAPEIVPGDALNLGAVAAALGDVTGDGVPDAAVGVPLASVDAYMSGAIWVLEGSASGAPPHEPYQVLSVDFERATMGSAIAVGDVVGVVDERADGIPDLLAIANGYQVNIEGQSLLIFPGLDSGGFAERPVIRPLAGESALAVGDFNGDGRDDVAVGNAAWTDRSVAPPIIERGSLSIFYGAEDRFPNVAGARRDALVYVASGSGAEAWRVLPRTGFGASLAAADIDGDGFDDLAVGLPDVLPSLAVPDAMAQVQVFFGDEPGIPSMPELVVTPAADEDCGDGFGRQVALADFDGDERADLVASQAMAPRYDALENHCDSAVLTGSTRTRAVRGNRGGAVLVWPAEALSRGPDAEEPAEVTTDAARWGLWQTAAQASGEALGYALSIGDLDGDAYPDLVAGAALDERLGRPQTENTGMVAAWSGELIASSFGGTAPRAAYLEPRMLQATGAANAEFGSSAAPLGLGALAVVEGLSSASGYAHKLPELFLAHADATHRLALSERTGAGQGFGGAVAWAPMDGATGDELIAGVSEQTLDVAPGSRGFGALWWATSPTQPSLAEPERWAWSLPTGRNRSGTPVALSSTSFASEGGFGSAFDRLDFDGDGWEDLAVLNFGTRRDRWCTPLTGVALHSGSSGVFVFRGSATGMGSFPSFVLSSPAARLLGSIHHADVNGDGRADVLLGDEWAKADSTWTTPNSGGVEVFFGRVYTPNVDASSNVVCEASSVFLGEAASGLAGTSVTGLGDLDRPKDGCEEFAVGTPKDGQAALSGASKLGGVRVVWGWGAGCVRAQPRVTVLGLGPVTAAGLGAIGERMAAGDVDGDGLWDLVVASPGWSRSALASSSVSAVGRVWVSPGSYLAARTHAAMTTHALSISGSAPISAYRLGVMTAASEAPLVPATGRWGVEGIVVGGRFGEALAVAPDPGDSARSVVVIGEPLGRRGIRDRQGGVTLWRVDAGGIAAEPFGWIAGEGAPGSRFGEALAVGVWDGQPALAVGAPRADAVGRDVGGVYPVRLAMPVEVP